MLKIGEKIRELRKRKGLTQEQLADVLAVSFQTVSKWENGVNTPDISMLPVVVGFFGVSMDEMFDFKPNSLQYKDRFIKFLADNGVLRFGEFELQSGRRSPYYIDETSMTGKRIGQDDSVTILCDTITSGETIGKTVELLKKHYGVNVSNIIVSLDRMEKGKKGQATALEELQYELGVTIVSMITFDDIIGAVQSGVIAGQNHLIAMKDYRENYCV